MFSTNPSDNEEITIIAPSLLTTIALADHSYCKLEPEDNYIELELVNEEAAVGTSEFGHPRIKHEGFTNKIRTPTINRKQKVGNVVPRNTLAGPRCWKRRYQRKQKVKNSVSKNTLAESHRQQSRRPIKRKKKRNKIHQQCKVEVLDVRDTLHCHECGEWSLTANDLLCHTLMTHDIDINKRFQAENRNVCPQDLHCMSTENLNDKKSTSKQFQVENQRTCPQKSETENQNDNKSKTTNSKGSNKVLPENQKANYPQEFQKENQNDNKIENTKPNEPNEISSIEEYLEDDLYDNIYPYEIENIQIYPDESQAETQNDKKVKTKAKEPNKIKTKKPEHPNKLLLKSQKARQNNGKTSKSKAAPKDPNKIFQPDFKCEKESQNHYKIKRTKSKGPNILILPCKNESQAENPGRKPHERSHLGIKRFACDFCQKTFDTKNALEMHTNSHTGAKPYTYDACDNTFAWKGNLLKHLKFCSKYNNGKIPPKRYECQECDFKARVQSQVKRHFLDVHGSDVFICDTCDRRFNTKAKMESHILVHATNKPFKCKLCDIRCATEQKLKDHIKTCHLAMKNHTCKECKKGFKTATCLKRHELIHSGIKPHTCQICNRSFTLKTGLSNHILSHSTDKPFSCVMCGSQFKTRFALISHQEIHKENRKIYVCAHCGDVLSSKGSFFRHLKSCLVLQGLPKKKTERTSSKLTYCEQCDKTFTYNYYVTKHKDAHKGFTCVICNMKFKDKQRCDSHELRHAGLKAYACDLCNKRFICKTSLGDHMNKHMKRKPYSCNLCPQRFAYKSNIHAHKRTFHSKTERLKTHECDMCHKKYFMKNHLRRHQLTHNKDKPCPCKKCGKRFSDKHQLRLHVKSHNNIKPYSCNNCKKSFKTKGHLKDHIFYTHERYTIKLACDICNRVFRDKVLLKSHMEKHKNSKIYSCDVCDKSFYTRQYLNRHKIVHSEKFEFSCSECGVTFKEKSNLIKHLLTHTDKPYICEVCDEPFRTHRLLQYHAVIHEAVQELYLCQYCGKAYADKNSKRRHEKNSCLKALRIRNKVR